MQINDRQKRECVGRWMGNGTFSAFPDWSAASRPTSAHPWPAHHHHHHRQYHCYCHQHCHHHRHHRYHSHHYILATFQLHSGSILTTFWLHSDYILTSFWLHCDYIVTNTFWLPFDYLLAIFWLQSNYILTTFRLFLKKKTKITKTKTKIDQGGGGQGGWSDVLDKLWSKKIHRPSMIFTVRCYIHLRWFCFS